jgi:hypothetical protein
MTAPLSRRRALLLLCVPLLSGCGTANSVKEKLTPKASVLGVSVVDVTPQFMTVKVDVKTDDVDLMLGMVKMKYRFTLLDAAAEQRNDNVLPGELMHLKDSGFAFLVKIPFDRAADRAKLGYLVQGSIVFKLIAEIADVPFSYQGEFSLKP